MTTDPQAILAALIRCPSVTPEEGGALTVLEEVLSALSFSVERPVEFAVEERRVACWLYDEDAPHG